MTQATTATWTNTANGASGYWTNGLLWGQATVGAYPTTGETAWITNTSGNTFTTVVNGAVTVGTINLWNLGVGQAWLVVTQGASTAKLEVSTLNLKTGGRIRIDSGGVVSNTATWSAFGDATIYLNSGGTLVTTNSFGGTGVNSGQRLLISSTSGSGGTWMLRNSALAVGSVAGHSNNQLVVNGGVTVFGVTNLIVGSATTGGADFNSLIITGAQSSLVGTGRIWVGMFRAQGNTAIVENVTWKSLGNPDNFYVGWRSSSNNYALLSGTNIDFSAVWAVVGGASGGSGQERGFNNTLVLTGQTTRFSAGSIQVGYGFTQTGTTLVSNNWLVAGAAVSNGGELRLGVADANNSTMNWNRVVLDGGSWTNSGVMTNGFSAATRQAQYNSFIASNGASAYFASVVTVGAGAGATSNSFIVNGATVGFDSNVTVGVSSATYNSLNANGATLTFASGITVGSGGNYNSLIATNLSALSGSGAITVGSTAVGNTGLVQATTAVWNGGGNNLVVGLGVSTNNYLSLSGGYWTNFGEINVGANSAVGAASGNQLSIDGATVQAGSIAVGWQTAAPASPFASALNNTLYLSGSTLSNAGTLNVGFYIVNSANAGAVTGNKVVVNGGSWTNVGRVIIGAGRSSVESGSSNQFLATNDATVYFGGGLWMGVGDGPGGVNAGSYNSLIVTGGTSALTGQGEIYVGYDNPYNLSTDPEPVGNTGIVQGATSAAWNGQGSNLTVGSGAGVSNNFLWLQSGTWTNFGVVTIGRDNASYNQLLVSNSTLAGSTVTVGGTGNSGNQFTLSGASTATVVNIVVANNNSLALGGGQLNVTGYFTNNNSTAAMVVGDGSQAATLRLTSPGGISYFAGGLVVTNQGALQGVGTISGNVTLRGGSVLSVGLSPGTLNVLSNVTWDGNVTNTFEINDFGGTAGVNWDLLQVAGSLTINASSGSPFVINLTSLTNGNVAGNAANFNSGTNYTVLFASAAEEITGYSASAFTVNTGAFSNSFQGSWGVVRNGNGLYLAYDSNAVLTPGFVWTNTAAGALWSTPGSWTNNTAPTDSASLILQFGTNGMTTAFTANNDNRVTNLNSIILSSSSTASNYLIGSALTFTGAAATVLQQGSASFVISNALNLAANVTNVTFRGFGGGDVVLASNITGSGQITKQGGWNLTLLGSNTWAGNFSMEAGTLTLGHAWALGTNAIVVKFGTVIGTLANQGYWVGNGWSNQQVTVGGYGVPALWTNPAHFVIGNGAATGNVMKVDSLGTLRVAGGLWVGTNGATFNSLVITNGGQAFSTAASTIGYNATNNSVYIYGTNSVWNNGGNTLNIGNGSVAVTGNVLQVDAGTLTNVQSVMVGANSDSSGNRLIVTNGGKVFFGVSSGVLNIGDGGGDSNTVIVAGGNATINGAGGKLAVGTGGNSVGNLLWIDSGGIVTNVYVVLGASFAGAFGNQLVVTNGGKLYTRSTPSTIGVVGTNNTAIVTGVGSVWNAGGTTITNGGTGGNNTLLVAAGGLLTNVDTLWTGGGTGGTNTTIIDSGSVYAAAGMVGRSSSVSNELRVTGTGLVKFSTGLWVTNGSGNRVTLNGGTLSTASTVYSNGTDFVVGDGTQAATLELLGGTHVFQNNLVLTNAGAIAATQTGVVTVAGGSGSVLWESGAKYVWGVTNFTGTAGGAAGLLWVNGTLTNVGAFTIALSTIGTNGAAGQALNFDTDVVTNYLIATATTLAGDYSSYTVDTASFQNPFDGEWSVTTVGNSLYLNYAGQIAYVWTNTSGLFGTAGQWTNNTAPPAYATNTALYFVGDTTGYTATNNIVGLASKLIVLSNDAGVARTIVGSNLTIGGVEPKVRQQGSGGFTFSNNLVLAGIDNANVTFGGIGDGMVVLAGQVSGTSGLTKTGTYTVVLGGSNSFSGVTVIQQGQIHAANQYALQSSQVSNLVTGGLVFSNITAATVRGLAGNGDITLTNVGSGGGAVALTSSGSGTYSGNLSGNGSLTKAGSGTQTLSGTNTYTGTTTVSGGTLTVSGQLAGSTNLNVTGGVFNWNSVGAMSNVSVLAVAGTVNFNTNGTLAGLSGAGAVTVADGSTLAVGYNNTTNTFAGNITGAGTLSKIGSGWLTLSGGSNDLGSVYVNGGALALTNNTYLAANSLWATGGYLYVYGGTLNVGVLAGSGTISNGQDFVVGDGGSAAQLNVVGGTLAVFNNVIVTNNGLLTGSGTLISSNGLGQVTIGSGAMIGAGATNTVGTLTISNTTVWADGGSYLWHWADTNGPAGTAWDLVQVQGALSNTASAGGFTINVGSVATNFDLDENYTTLIATGTTYYGAANAYSVLTTGVLSQADGIWAVTNMDAGVFLTYVGEDSYVWTNTSGAWSTLGQWVNSASIPSAGRSNLVVYFGGGAGNYVSSNDLAGIAVKRLWFTNNTANIGTIIGSNITLVGVESLRQDGTGTMIISNGLTLGRNTTFGGSSNGTVRLDGVISGNYGFTKTGPWTLVLGGSNTFSGGVNLLGGVTRIDKDEALGAADNAVSLTNATLAVTNSFTSLRGFSVSNAVFDVAADSTYTIAGSNFSGAAGASLIKSNGGTLVISNTTGTVAGRTVLAEGALRIGSGTWGAITNAAGAGALVFDPTVSATVNGAISGAGGITMQGAGTLFLTGINTNLDGGLVINSGTVAVSRDEALGKSGAPVVVTNGATLRTTASFDSSRNLTSQFGGAVFWVDSGVTNNWGGTITGDGGLTKAGAGLLNLTTSNNYTGATIVTGGTLRVNGTLIAGGGLVTIDGGTLGGTGTIHRSVLLENGGTLAVGNGAPGVLTVGSGSNLTWMGGGTYQAVFNDWSSSGVAGTDWSKLVVSGNLILNTNGSPLVIDLVSSVAIDGTTNRWLLATAGGIVSNTVTPSNFNILTANLTSGPDGAFGVEWDTTNLYLKTTAGYVWTSMVNNVWTTNGNWSGGVAPPANQYSTTLIFRGNGVASNDNASFIVTKIIFDMGAGSNQVLNGGQLIADGFQAPSWEQRSSGTVVVSNAVRLDKALTLAGTGSGTVTLAGVLSGANGFTKTSAASNWTLVVSTGNTFTGAVVVTGGTLQLGHANALGYTGNVAYLSGVTLTSTVASVANRLNISNTVTVAYDGSSFTLGGGISGLSSSANLIKSGTNDLVIAGSGGTTYAGNILMQDTGNLIFSNANALTISGVITGAVDVLRTGSGTVTLSGANLYTGNTRVEGGTLVVAHAQALGTSTASVTNGGAGVTSALLAGGGGTLTFSRQIVLQGTEGSGTRTIGAVSNTRGMFTNLISGTGGLTIGGGGVVELTYANTYAGTTTVSGATLVVNRTDGLAPSTGPVVVASGGVLGGTGLVVNSTVESGGRLAPGEYLQVGSLTLSNSTWNSGGGYRWQIANNGLDWDRISLTNLTLAGLGQFTIDLVDFSWTNAIIALDGTLTPTVTNTFEIASTQFGGFGDGSFFKTNSWAAVVDGYGWWVTTNGDSLYMNYGAGNFIIDEGPTQVIPEPNVLLLWLSSIATIYAARRRLTKVAKK